MIGKKMLAYTPPAITVCIAILFLLIIVMCTPVQGASIKHPNQYASWAENRKPTGSINVPIYRPSPAKLTKDQWLSICSMPPPELKPMPKPNKEKILLRGNTRSSTVWSYGGITQQKR